MTGPAAPAQLGRIHAGHSIPWLADCQGTLDGRELCDWQLRPYGSKARAGAAARRHLAERPSHRVILTATTWQLVYIPEPRS